MPLKNTPSKLQEKPLKTSTGDPEDKKILFEQYKLLVDSINKTNDLRETGNNYWITVNTLGISAVAYIRDAQDLTQHQKPLVLWVIVLLGLTVCGIWFNFLATIKKRTEMNNNFLIEIEKYLPLKIFTKGLAISRRQEGENSLTFKEMIVPCLFLIGYLTFAILLF